MGSFCYLSDQRFGRLVVLSRACAPDPRVTAWLCRCDCGNERIVRSQSLREGNTTSCGCFQRERTSERSRASAIHGACIGGRSSPEYRAWRGAKDRCENPQCESYKNYGARGIYMAQEWRDNFPRFLAALGPKPSPKHSLDRYPDNDGPYAPWNCRWATWTEQANNRRKRKRRARPPLLTPEERQSRLARGDRSGPRLHPECILRGEQVASSKLTADQVIEIRRLYAAGCITQTQLAQRFGIAQTKISCVVRRVTWAHVA